MVSLKITLKFYLKYWWSYLTYRGIISHDKGEHSKELSKKIYLSNLKNEYKSL